MTIVMDLAAARTEWLLENGKASFDLLVDVLQDAVSAGSSTLEMMIRPELVKLLAVRGAVDEAHDHLARIREIRSGGEDWLGLAGQAGLAQALVSLVEGDLQEAERLFGGALETFQSYQVPWEEAEAHLWWARVAKMQGRAAAASFEAALAVYDRIDAPPPWRNRVKRLQGT